jgi:predicted nuclease with TOPRIM domain
MSTTTPPTADEDSIRDEVERLDDGLNGLFNKVSELSDRVEELEAEADEKDTRIRDLEAEVRRLEARTDLIRVVEQADDMTGKQRSITLLQHLQKAAQRNSDNDDAVTGDGRASVTREQAEIALQHPDVDRTTIYDDMRRAVRLVGDEDVCYYDSDRDGGSQLVLDVTNGDLPTKFNRSE